MSHSLLKKTVDEIIDDLPRAEQVIMKKLRSFIKECLPKATEKNSYGAPFYSHHRMICFIWPPSVRWGPKKEWNDKAEKGREAMPPCNQECRMSIACRLGAA